MPTRERLELLRIAYFWFAGKPAKYAPLGPQLAGDDNGDEWMEQQPATTTTTQSEVQKKHEERMAELELDIALVRTSMEAGLPLPVLDGTAQRAETTEAALGRIVDQLVCGGHVGLARCVCRRFAHNSDHLKLAAMLCGLASGADGARTNDTAVVSLLRNLGVWADEAVQAACGRQDVAALFERVAVLVPALEAFTRRLIADHRVALVLGVPFAEVNAATHTPAAAAGAAAGGGRHRRWCAWCSSAVHCGAQDLCR